MMVTLQSQDIVLSGIFYAKFGNDPESISRWQERYAIAIRNTAIECNCHLADLRAWMLEELDYPSLICDDGIHPNEAGHAIIAQKAMEHFPHKD